MTERIRIGVIGWTYPEWKGPLYPANAKPADFLKLYAQRFPLVESASAYYGMPKTSTVEQWSKDTPDDFEISLKVPEWIIRKKPDDPDLPKALATLLVHLEPLSSQGKLGALVAQFHPSFKREKKAAELAAFVAHLPTGPRWAVELRDASWWHEETYAMLRAANVTLVWSALGGEKRTPPVMTTDSLYLRLFGDRELEEPFDKKRRDATPELQLWADRIKNEGATAKRVDVVLSKYLEGYAPGSAATLETMLGVTPRSARPESGPRQTKLM